MPIVPEMAMPGRDVSHWTWLRGDISRDGGDLERTCDMMPAKSAVERLAGYERVDIATTCFERLFFIVGSLCNVCWWEEVSLLLLSLVHRDIPTSLVCLVRIVHLSGVCVFSFSLLLVNLVLI